MEHISLNLRGIRAEELSFKQNNVKIPKDAKLDLKPSFSRRVRKTPDNEKLHFVTLEVKIESSETSPKPFDLKVCLTAYSRRKSEATSNGARSTCRRSRSCIPISGRRSPISRARRSSRRSFCPWWAARSFPRTGNRPKSFRTDFHLGDTIRKMGEKSGRIVNRLTLL